MSKQREMVEVNLPGYDREFTTYEMKQVAGNLYTWMQSETKEFNQLVFRLLASLQGGEEIEGMGYEPFDYISWKEAELLGDMLHTIQNKDDVQYLCAYIVAQDEKQRGDEPWDDDE